MSWGESPQTSVEIILIILVEPALHQPGDRDEGAGDARAEALVLVELHMVGEHLRGLDVGGRGGGGPEARAFECCARRSEEHTSELQSLMRISYAVLCLKKKKKKQY